MRLKLEPVPEPSLNAQPQPGTSGGVGLTHWPWVRYGTSRGSDWVTPTRFTRLLPQAVPYEGSELSV